MEFIHGYTGSFIFYCTIIMQGTVKFYNDQKGFGFITYGEGDVFFHVRQCQEGYLPQQDDVVTFDIGEGRDGRSSAINVIPTGEVAESTQEEVA